MVFLLGESHFGMYSVGETVNISCGDPNGFLVVWLSSTGEVISYGLTSAALNINSITDRHHEQEYTCRIQSPEATRDLNYTIIIISKVISSVSPLVCICN